MSGEVANERLGTAYHEAGHVVMGCITNRIPMSAIIVADGPVRGKTEFEGVVPAYAQTIP
jgi:hypothetical protein